MSFQKNEGNIGILKTSIKSTTETLNPKRSRLCSRREREREKQHQLFPLGKAF